MIKRFTLARGSRVVFEDDNVLCVFAPVHGIRQRPIVVGRWALPLLDKLRDPHSFEQLLAVTSSGMQPGAVREFLDECLRFGVLRPERTVIDTSRLAQEDAGFLVYALGAQRYGRLAVNVARTIARAAPEARVALCHDGSAVTDLSEQDLAVFDRRVSCPPEISNPGGRFEPLWAKLHAEILSPYRHTIVVDADSVFFAHARVAEELLRYRDCDFAPTCSFTHLPGRVEPGDRVIVWAEAAECFQRFAISRPLHQTHLFYFALRSSAATRRLFETARAVYLELGTRPLASMRRWYGQRVSAELAMSIATGLCEFELYCPAHMPLMHNHVPCTPASAGEYLGFTFCASPPDAAWIERYDRVVADATGRGMPAVGWLAANA